MKIYNDAHRLPARLWIVRHGESAGNVARDAAMREGAARITLPGRDMDVPLSALGEKQAQDLGRWFAELDETPETILCSPYRRACDTAGKVATELKSRGFRGKAATDERLREKEFGIVDGLTRAGIEQSYPDIAAYRTLLGKFYHRAPGGESWCDVILRLRSMLDTLSLHHAGKRVLIVSHQVVVLCLRYLLEEMDEAEILAIDRRGDVANCSVTEYCCEDGQLKLVRYNHVAPLSAEGTPVTAAPDEKAAAP